ncbi:MAG: hypothetical protein FJ312_03145 [SAR202 cluster bacterium]|nr:hypothetical protein [SAR202 cluster bacterium]
MPGAVGGTGGLKLMMKLVHEPRSWPSLVLLALLAGLILACGKPDPFASDRVSCTEQVKNSPSIHSEVLKEARERYREALRAVEGVVGLGIGYVYEGAKRTDGIGIIVYASGKRVAEGLPNPDDSIPDVIEGCTIDVQFTDPELVGEG